MEFDRHSAAALRRVDLVVNNGGAPDAAPLPPWRKGRPAAGHAAAMLAFTAGLIVPALGAWADEPVRPQPTAERAGTDNVRGQPSAKQFAPPNQPDIGAREARAVDALYRLLVGPQPATSSDFSSSPGLLAALSNDADRTR